MLLMWTLPMVRRGEAGAGVIDAIDTLSEVDTDPKSFGRPGLEPVNGLYIVTFRDAPLAQYSGTVRGMLATQPARGQRLDTKTPAAAKYAKFLSDKKVGVQLPLPSCQRCQRMSAHVSARCPVRPHPVWHVACLFARQSALLNHKRLVEHCCLGSVHPADCSPECCGTEAV